MDRHCNWEVTFWKWQTGHLIYQCDNKKERMTEKIFQKVFGLPTLNFLSKPQDKSNLQVYIYELYHRSEAGYITNSHIQTI